VKAQSDFGLPKHRVFQQSDDMRWEPVFERIVEALREKVHAQA
jgi:hypothetical protein